MSRRLSLLGPPVLTAQTAHFPPPLASATASATVSTVRPVAAAASASSDTALGLPTVDRHYLQLCYRRIFASSHSLPFSLCSPLPPAHDWEQTWKSRPLRRPPPPSHQSGHPPRPPCAIRKAHFALPCGCRLALLSPLAFPSHSRTRSTSLLHPPKGRSRESKINNQSCAIAVRGSLLYRLVSPRNPTKQLDCCSRPLASRHHCPSSTMATAVRQPFAPLDGARLQTLTSLKNRQNCRPSFSPGSVLLLTDSSSHRERPRQAKGRRGRGGWLGERGPDALF